MTSLVLITLAVFLIVPAAAAWTWGIFTFVGWLSGPRRDRRTLVEINAEAVVANYTAMVRKRHGNAEIVQLIRRGPRSAA